MDEPATIVGVGRMFRDQTLSPVDLVTGMLERTEVLDPILGCYVSTFPDLALDFARQAERDLVKGLDRGPLHGIPIGVKDIIRTREGPTTGQSTSMPTEWGALAEGTVVKRLRGAGAIVMGKTSTMEYAVGLPDIEGSFPLPRNPWSLDLWAGGSSSGTASGIAAGLFLGGLGTDTAGSLRCPAAFCGISTIKPTYGLVPSDGCIPLGYSYDHIGPMARTAADCALLLDAMTGDPARQSRLDKASRKVDDGKPLVGCRIGDARAAYEGGEEADPSTSLRMREMIEVLRDLGAEVVEVDLPELKLLASITTVGAVSEGYVFHASALRERWEQYTPSARVGLTPGLLVSAGEYLQLQRARSVLMRRYARILADYDCVVMPTLTFEATVLGELEFPQAFYISALTAPWNALGVPAASIPMGLGSRGLPLGLQIVAGANQDMEVLSIAQAIQERTDCHLLTPVVSTGDSEAARE